MNKKLFIVLTCLIAFSLATSVFAKGPDGENTRTVYKPNSDFIEITATNASNWEYWVTNTGKSAHTPEDNSGGIYPRATAATIYQDGLIWGSVVNDTRNPDDPQIRVGGSTYRIGTVPGHIQTAGTATTPPVASDANAAPIYRIRTDWESLTIGEATVINDAADRFRVARDAVTDEMQQAILDQYRDDWNNWPTALGAPVDGSGNPGIAGADQVLWFVVNDLDDGASTNLYGSPSTGLEIQTTLWVYNQPGATLGQIIFKRFRVINKSGFRLDSMFICQWSDPDVGVYTDDYVGSDVGRSLGFAYTGSLTDGDFEAFGLPPAAVGYDFFQGPLVDGVAGQDLNNNGVDDASDYGLSNFQEVGPGKINLPMTSFGYFAAGSAISDPTLGDYEGTQQWYNLLNGYLPLDDLENPQPFTAGFGPNAGQATFFPVSGDAVKSTGDIDGFGTNLPPGDRRMTLSSGPFTMEPGDEQEIVLAVVGGIIAQDGGNNRNAVAAVKLNDDFAQFIFNARFEGIPSPPPAPKVVVTPLEDKVVLEWGSDAERITATEADDALLGFNFEGYNVYQLPSASATKSQATLIATFDKDNTISQINQDQFLPEFGDIVNVPVRFGTNTGLQRFISIDRDFIKDTPLFAGNRYYYAVTAYNAKDKNGDGLVDTDVPEASLESSLEIITVIPQSPKPGTEYPSSVGDVVEVTRTGGVSTGGLTVEVVDPAATTGDNYEVSFEDEPQFFTNAGGDTLGTWYKWRLTNTSTGQVLTSGNTNLNGDNNYNIFEGVLVRPSGPKAAGLAGWDFDGNRWVSGVNWGGQEFFGGLDIGANFFGSTLTLADLFPLHMDWQDQASVDANGYASKGATVRRDLGYPFSGIGELPFTAWDNSDPANPRQVNVSFVEDDTQGAPGTNANLIWDMGWNGTEFGALGAREYLFFHNTDYDEGATYASGADPTSQDVAYAIWPQQRGSRGNLLAEFTMDIFANLPNNPADKFTFSTEAVVTGDQNMARAEAEKINAFPNPYYAFNPEEANRFNRFVTFTHLPQKATVRIFSLSGVQVRKLDKNDESQFLQWDLLNESTLPVASGVYICHVELPDLGMEKVVKLFIVQGAEILEYF